MIAQNAKGTLSIYTTHTAIGERDHVQITADKNRQYVFVKKKIKHLEMELNRPLSAYKEELEKLLQELSIQGLQCPADHTVSICQQFSILFGEKWNAVVPIALCPCKMNLLS